jgi:DNA polymerase-3 subunit delta'
MTFNHAEDDCSYPAEDDYAVVDEEDVAEASADASEFPDVPNGCDETGFDVVLGHSKAEAMLAGAIAADKIFPTWIFYGPLGVGKSTMAHKFAKCLLSGKMPIGGSLDISPDDPVHNLIRLRIHPDLFVLEQTDEFVSLDSIRDLMTKIRKMPTLSRWRVVILENASHLNKNIYNCLLKILEEPPRNTVIMMICTHIGSIPKTLLSRAAKISFRPIETTLVVRKLEEMGVANAARLAKLSGGSIGYAIYLSQNNGIAIYDQVLKIFGTQDSAARKKALAPLLEDNGANNNFVILLESILRMLKIYVDMLIGVEDLSSEEDLSALRWLVENARLGNARLCASEDGFGDLSPAYLGYAAEESKKTLEIIEMLSIGDRLMLHKSTLIAYVFEKFFGE